MPAVRALLGDLAEPAEVSPTTPFGSVYTPSGVTLSYDDEKVTQVRNQLINALHDFSLKTLSNYTDDLDAISKFAATQPKKEESLKKGTLAYLKLIPFCTTARATLLMLIYRLIS